MPELTVRQQILNQLLEYTEEISDFRTVILGKKLPSDIETLSMPVCFIYSGDESRREEQDSQHENYIWNIIFEIWTPESEPALDLEYLLGVVYNKIYQDNQLKGLCQDLIKIGSSFFTVSSQDGVNGLIITFLLDYRNKYGNPYQV